MIRVSSVAISAAIILCSQSAAQSEQSAETKRFDPVVVTATGTETSVVDIPMSVTTLEGQTLANAGKFVSAEDLTDLFTGVEAAIANGNQIAFQIRGIGAVDHQALTPTAAAVYADNVYLATNVQTGPLLYDLERVEVLKGPQGTLFGRNASSGAISIFSAQPGADQESYAEVGIGNFDRFDLNAAYGTSLSENVHVRLAGKYLQRGPVLENTAGPDAAGGERDEFGLRAGASIRTRRAKHLTSRALRRRQWRKPDPAQ